MCGQLSLDTRGICVLHVLWFVLLISNILKPTSIFKQVLFPFLFCRVPLILLLNLWIWRLCRSKSNQYPTTSLLQIEGVNTPEEVNWYLGKRLAYVYKAKTRKNGSLYRCTWGKVARPHGNSGVVRARFRKNLPPASLVFNCISPSIVAFFIPLGILNMNSCRYFTCVLSLNMQVNLKYLVPNLRFCQFWRTQ